MLYMLDTSTLLLLGKEPILLDLSPLLNGVIPNQPRYRITISRSALASGRFSKLRYGFSHRVPSLVSIAAESDCMGHNNLQCAGPWPRNSAYPAAVFPYRTAHAFHIHLVAQTVPPRCCTHPLLVRQRLPSSKFELDSWSVLAKLLLGGVVEMVVLQVQRRDMG